MTSLSMTVTAREQYGKGPARQARFKGMIPAVVYGQKQEPLGVQVDPVKLRKALSTAYKKNQIINLTIEGGSHPQVKSVLIREIQYHPVKGTYQHVDFWEFIPHTPIEFSIPVLTTGKAKGVIEGGRLNVFHKTIKINCLPENLPESITIDVTEFGIGDNLKISEVSLPDGVKAVFHQDYAVLSVDSGRAEVIETPAAAEVAPTAEQTATTAAQPAKAEAGKTGAASKQSK